MITYKNAAVCSLSLVLALAAGCTTTASSKSDAAGKPTEGDGSARQVSLDLGKGETMKFVLCPAGEFMMGTAMSGKPAWIRSIRITRERPPTAVPGSRMERRR